MAAQNNLILGKPKRLSGCYPDLFLDQIDTCHPFGHRMLHLNPCIHLHKIKASIAIQQKFNCPCVHISRSLCRLYGGLSHFFAKRR